ncbi:hypothetical protein DRO53_00440 [Candidatus Bathyarchaeota archaeon]|nr:MAG: hypothetical protein DRO46_03035 [Candidatus Hecatellales archaeon]RLI35751.1 MAG: hypothetical protein DRO53_00440 [Candidatus Bathyarchaeota archaeon]
MGKPYTVKLRRRIVTVKWKCKRRGTVRVKRYLRWWLQIPANLEVSDLVGVEFKARREGDRIIFEPA